MTRSVRVVVSGSDRAWRAAIARPTALARRAARAALKIRPGAVPPGASEIGIVLSDDAAVRSLNKTHRGQDHPTNVLSFPVEADGGPQGLRLLGDVVLARETLINEAGLAGKPIENHFSHLVVHGILHLLGFDHETERDAELMEAAEKAALAHLGMPDPYGTP